MSSYLESLPAEVLANVFQYHADDRKQIGSCRLASKTLKTASLPFLITKLVFAKRLRDIAKAMELAFHPYFSHFITEISYDLSYWRRLEYDDYTEECNAAERLGLRRFYDAEWYWHTLVEDDFQSSLHKSPAFRPPKNATKFLAHTSDGMSNRVPKLHDDVAVRLVRAESNIPGNFDLSIAWAVT